MKHGRNLKRLLAAAMIAILLLASAPAALALSAKAKINSSSARVYSSPSTSAKYSVKAVKNTSVKLTGYANGWARISYKGTTAYVKAKYLNLTDRVKLYTNTGASVYRSAGSSKVGTLKAGSVVYAVGVDGSYYRVQNKSGTSTGYIKASQLSTEAEFKKAYQRYLDKKAAEKKAAEQKPAPAPETKPATRIDKVIALAQSYLGRDYAHSSNPPKSFNCSSFVKYCMEKGGSYSMKDSAATQAADSRYEKITSGFKRGDVLCFDTDNDGSCDHTAIYLGSSKFIEASQNADKVQTNTLDSWYSSHLLFARRPA